jgi:uncharacterized RDD family membrane protein YckC
MPPQEIKNSAPMPVSYAGFWRRFLALIIDGFIFGAVESIFAAFARALGGSSVSVVGQYVYGFMIFFQILYFSFFEASSRQATPGKMAMGIVVTGLEGERISFWRSLGRTLGKIVSMLTLFIGFIMVAFTARKQALHDMFAGCLVVKRRQ